ncbi:MAG: fibronectin type III domain-containing protein [Roseburia sp.]|nr:fibronectin type III domain-containing protein [Roseburia sp.]
MNKRKRSLWAWLLSVCMAVSAVPLPARAAQANQEARSALAAEDMAASEASVSGNRIQHYSLVQEIPIDASHFPDKNFRKYVEEKIDTDGDGKLGAEEQVSVTDINCTNMEISDLTGIEYFTNLRVLRCNESNLSSLDVSGCPALEYLSCFGNNLSSLNVSGNPALRSLDCSLNDLSSLDVDRNAALEYLDCHANNLSSLNISGCPTLEYLSCFGNNLSSLDVSGNPVLMRLDCSSNNLSSLDVSGCPALAGLDCSDNYYYMLSSSDNTYDLSELPGNFDVSRASGWEGGSVEGNILTVEAGVRRVTYTYDVDGSAGNRTGEFVLHVLSGVISIDKSHFPDKNFRKYVKEKIDTDGDGKLGAEEQVSVTGITCAHMEILDLTGIEYFTNLTSLGCDSNNLSSLDVSGNPELKYLYCDENNLSSLDVSGNPVLEILYCEENSLSSLDVSGCLVLKKLNCCGNNLSSLDVSGNPTLKILYCEENSLSSLDVSGCPALTDLDCSSNNLSSLNVSRNPALRSLDCSSNNLSSLDVSGCPALTDLDCFYNNLSKLDVSGNAALKDLNCDNNNLSSLDVSGNLALTYLYCDNNNLSSLDVSENAALKVLYCSDNYYYMPCSSDNTYDLSELPGNFDVSRASGWEGGSVEGNILTVEAGVRRVTYTYDVDGSAGNRTGEFVLHVLSGVISIDKSHFPDKNFRKYVKEKIDTDGDGKLGAEEQVSVTDINCTNMEISDLTGIEYFVNLTTLGCGSNNLSNLDVSRNPTLKSLSCEENKLSSLDVSGNVALENLNCSGNKLSSLDVSGNPALTDLSCDDNTYSITRSSDNTYDLSKLPGSFKVSRASNWQGGSVKKNILTVEADAEQVTYTYDVDGNKGRKTAEFTLKITGGPHTHTYKTTVTKATLKKDGESIKACTVCGKVKSTKVISRPASITLKKTSYTYNGKAKKPGVVVKDAAGETIGSSNYTVTYEKGRKKIGKYKVTVTFKGNYSGKKSLSFTIKPPAPKLRSVAAGSKKLTVKWKKQSRATGYEIQYSTNKNFTKSTVKKVTVKKKSTVKKTITGLKAKKTYYIRIRAYKTVSGKKYYSDWSSPKKAVTRR